MRKRSDRARDADVSEVNPEDIETRIREAGRHFALTKAIFLIDDDVMSTEEDDSFDFDHEFDSIKSERQGQLRDILTVLPDDVKPKIKQRWVQDSVRNQFLIFRALFTHATVHGWLAQPALLHGISRSHQGPSVYCRRCETVRYVCKPLRRVLKAHQLQTGHQHIPSFLRSL
jgi:hypothetical protein